MAKQDAEVPDVIPAKRRALEAAPDYWVAVWLERDDLTPSQRARLLAVKEDRKLARAREERPVGLVLGEEGVTPDQLARLPELLAGATAVHHTGVPSKVHQACRSVAPVVVHRDDPRGVIKASSLVVGAVRSARPEGSDVWELIRYAKHRRLPVRVVLPDGQVQGDDGG